MPISVIDPISAAMDRAKLVTFRPFDIGKWFVLGFCAFLEALGGGGGLGNLNQVNNFNGRGGGRRAPGTPDPWDEAVNWVSTHAAQTALVALAAVLLLIGISLVLLWLGSRGKFMFLDGVARNTAAVVEPWKRLRGLGNSLFAFRTCLMLASWALFLLVAGGAVAIAWHDIQARTFGSGAKTALVAGAVVLVPLWLAVTLVQWATDRFVATIMYARGSTIGPAWREFRRDVLAGHVGTFILYLLMELVLSLCVVVAAMLIGCFTLCIGFLPYIANVVLLPLEVFMRSYSVYFLQQFGPQYVIMHEGPPLGYGFPVIMPGTPYYPPPPQQGWPPPQG